MSRHSNKISRRARAIQSEHSLMYTRANAISQALNELGWIDEPPAAAIAAAVEAARAIKKFDVTQARTALLVGAGPELAAQLGHPVPASADSNWPQKANSGALDPEAVSKIFGEAPAVEPNRPADIASLSAGAVLVWSDGTKRTVIAPGLLSDDLVGTVSIADALSEKPDGFLGSFESRTPRGAMSMMPPAKPTASVFVGTDEPLTAGEVEQADAADELPTRVDASAIADLPANASLEEVCASYDEGLLAIPLGVTAAGELIKWEPRRHSHLLVTGAIGRGVPAVLKLILAACTYFGVETYVIDPKGIEYVQYRDYPNVAAVATEAYEATALINELYTRMMRRYRRSQRGLVRPHPPMVVIIDDYRALQADLTAFWHDHRPAKGAPRTSPAIDQLGSLLRLARSSNIFIAAYSPPMLTAMPGETRDQFIMRVSVGTINPAEAQIIWGDATVGQGEVADLLESRGRALVSREGRPVPVQTLYVPPMNAGGAHDKALLGRIRPKAALVERRVFVIPPHDPDTTAPGAPTWADDAPAEGDHEYYATRGTLLAAEHPEHDPLSDRFAPPSWWLPREVEWPVNAGRIVNVTITDSTNGTAMFTTVRGSGHHGPGREDLIEIRTTDEGDDELLSVAEIEEHLCGDEEGHLDPVTDTQTMSDLYGSDLGQHVETYLEYEWGRHVR